MSKISELISATSSVQVQQLHHVRIFSTAPIVETANTSVPDLPDSISIPIIPNTPYYDGGSTEINQEIDRPTHYASKSGRDVIDWCEDFGLMDNAYIFNIFKYLCRAGKKSKNSILQDALKARIYLDRFIESLQK